MPTAEPIQTRTADMPLAGLQMEVRNVTRAAAGEGDGQCEQAGGDQGETGHRAILGWATGGS